MRSIYRCVKYLFPALVLLSPLIVKLFVGEWACIPSASMQPTLMPGDWIWYNKYPYGTVLPRRIAETPILQLFCIFPWMRHLDRQTAWKPFRLKGTEKPARMDIMIFRSPVDTAQLLVKRCIGLPGDTLRIHRGKIYINGLRIDEQGERIVAAEAVPAGFPQAMQQQWTVFEYGPLVIPFQGMPVPADSLHQAIYAETVARETPGSAPETPAVFQDDYYFVLGDNRGNSLDSRFIGLVPYRHVRGKAARILFSRIDSYRFRNDRFFKRLR